MHPTPVHCHHIAYGSRNNDTVGVTYCSHKYCWSLLQGHFRGPWRNVDFSEKYSPLPTWNGDLNFSEWGPNGYLILSEMGIFSSRNGDKMWTWKPYIWQIDQYELVHWNKRMEFGCSLERAQNEKRDYVGKIEYTHFYRKKSYVLKAGFLFSNHWLLTSGR